MVQTFNPETVLLSQTLDGRPIESVQFTQEFINQLVKVSKTMQLGSPVKMDGRMQRVDTAGELTDAYFVGEGEKIGTAKIEQTSYVLEARKIAVILPATEEALTYTWSRYFQEVLPAVVDKFNKKIDGAVFLGLHNNVFGNNVLAAATAAGNVVAEDINFSSLLTLEGTSADEPTALVGHRTLNTAVRGLVDGTGQYVYDRTTSTVDGLPYHELKLAKGEKYPVGTLLAGDFKNGIKYGFPNGSNIKAAITNAATLSKVQNAGPDAGDVHLFEQDMQAVRFVLEIAVAIPTNEAFAALQAPVAP